MQPTDSLFCGFMADFREDRRVVPSRCVKVIRDRYSDPEGNYTGFIPAQGAGW